MMKIKNALIYFLYKLSKKFGDKRYAPNKAERILIVTTTGLGDTIWATPAIASIKKSLPDAHLGVLTSLVGHAILKDNPHIDEFFLISHSPFFELKKLQKKIKKSRFDTALIFHISQRATLPLIYFSKIPRIVGTEGMNKGLDFLLSHALKKIYQHEIERRLEIASVIGVKPTNTLLELYPLKSDEEKASSITTSLKGPIIGMHPGAKDGFKMWPKERFIELAKKLQQEFSASVVITGDASEKALAKEIADATGALSIAGELSLKESAALLGKLDLYIANDTGPMHMAFAMKTKVMAFFGPTDPNLCGPYKAADAFVMHKPKTCTPCLSKKCKEPFCMMQISTEAAFEKAKEILRVG